MDRRAQQNRRQTERDERDKRDERDEKRTMSQRQIEQKIERLKDKLVEMATLARNCFSKAIENLKQRDESLVKAVREIDHQIEELELHIDEICIELLASEGPYASDLRFIYIASKITKDVERIGDESCALARYALRLPLPTNENIDSLSLRASEALDKAIKALADNDAALAQEVLEIEPEIDRLEDGIMHSSSDIATILAARALERIGDLSTNIAESIIYKVQAKDIRHGNY